MRCTYRCGVCRAITGHPSELAAEAEQADHAARAHHGRWPEDGGISGPHSKPRQADPVRAWLDRHNRIIGPAMLQFWLLDMLAAPVYLLFTHVFG